MIALDILRERYGGTIEIDHDLAPHVTYRIGGPADLYLEPESSNDVVELVRYFAEAEIPWHLIGNGSNVLISDSGIRGAVINLEKGFRHLEFEDGIVRAGAGVKLAKFVDFAIRNGRGGAEMLAGIPGTLGGAVIMNAGAYGGEISDFIVDVEIVRDLKLMRISKPEGDFKYRSSGLTRDIVLEATFEMPEGVPEPLKERRKELLKKRNASQPVKLPNAGSIFKNPEGDFAARLIEESGLKGTRIGGAEVSELHANFIVNADNASAEDVVELIRAVRSKVFRDHDVALELEVKPIGFDEETMETLTGTPTA